MSHKVKVYDHEQNENNSQTFWVKILYDHDEDGEKEEIWDNKVTYSDHQVADGKLENRFRQLAETKIEEFESENVDGSKFVGNEYELG